MGALEVGATGKKNQFLRAVFRRAVELQYDQSKAEARLSSAQSGQYTIVESNEVVILSSGASAQMKITFAKGAGSRGNYEETVELLDMDKVKGVIGESSVMGYLYSFSQLLFFSLFGVCFSNTPELLNIINLANHFHFTSLHFTLLYFTLPQACSSIHMA